MRQAAFTPVDRVPLVGGRPCLDFVNTTGARASRSPRERLRSYAAFLVWAGRAGVLPQLDGMRLAGLAEQRPAEAEQALLRVRGVRELLYRILRASLGGSPATDDLRVLTSLAAEAGRWRMLAVDGPRLTWRAAPPEHFEGVVWPVVTDAVELLVSDAMRSLKQCGECDWLFLDETRNGGRRWCKKACGDRVKSRRYYARRVARA